jgi:hypothetical protein
MSGNVRRAKNWLRIAGWYTQNAEDTALICKDANEKVRTLTIISIIIREADSIYYKDEVIFQHATSGGMKFMHHGCLCKIEENTL